MAHLIEFLIQTGWITAALVALIPFFLICYRISDKVLQPPGVDLIIGCYTFAPWIVGFWLWSWSGLGASVLAEVIVLHIFCIGDTVVRGKPRKTLMGANNQIVGITRNQLGLHATLPAIPLFWGIRFATVFVYPFVSGFAKLPKYKHSDWITISRQKFKGLIGYDLIWCLYCDWMTGLWSLATEMLRNVESFWCPIRFGHENKCEKCITDFPDIARWAKSTATIEEVADLMLEKYQGRENHSWWGHENRCGGCSTKKQEE